MMKNKKIALLASILVVTLVVGVYAAVRLSTPITTSWTLRESGTTLELYWAAPYWNPGGGDLYRSGWIYASIGLRNNGLATYTVLDWFKIWTGPVLPPGCIKMEYYVAVPRGGEQVGWNNMTSVLTYDGGTVTGYFGPRDTGFPVDPDYDVVTSFRIMFDAGAPIDVEYHFEAWVEQFP
jgi:hypothetical protein